MGELTVLKKELMSLVVSSPTPITMNKLIYEHRKLVDERLPLAKYGHKDVLSFFKDVLSDCFIIENGQRDPVVTPIVPHEVEHIVKMISKQKINAKDKSKGRRGYVLKSNAGPKRNDVNTPTCSQTGLMEELCLRISILLKEHPEGIWCTDLMSLYKKKFGCTLQYQRAGHSSVVSLVQKMRDTVIVIRHEPNRDWRLHSSEHPPPPPQPLLLAPSPPDRSPTENTTDPAEDALPGLPYERGVFPEDYMQPNQTVPAPSLDNLHEGSTLKVCVAELYSPSHFWLHRQGTELDELFTIMNQMNEYYESESGAQALPPAAIKLGHYCAKYYDGCWHRSVIVRFIGDHVKVRHIDYGTIEEVSKWDLRPLRREWAQLPAQALRARLSGVQPIAKGSEWPVNAAKDMLQIVESHDLTADVVQVDRADAVLEVRLHFDGLSIGAQLIEMGHADKEDSNYKQRPYYFPQFSALEEALTLSYSDLLLLQQHDVSPYFVDEYTRFLAPSVEKTTSKSDPL